MKTAESIYNGEVNTDVSDATETTDIQEKISETADTELKGETETKIDKAPAEADIETGDASPASKNGETTVPLSAMHGERDRRKNAERERDELRSKLDSADTIEAKKTSVFDDESKFRDEITGDFNRTLNNQRYNQSQFFAERDIGKDELSVKVDTFKQLVAENPTLNTQINDAPSPYHEMIKIVDQHADFDKIKDIDSYKDKLRAEVRAEVKKELQAEIEGNGKLRNSIPESLVNDASAGGIDTARGFTPKTAEELYN